jgi:hypothetical protein
MDATTIDPHTLYDEPDVQPDSLVWAVTPRSFPLNATSPALAASMVAKAGEGKLFGFTVSSTNAVAQFVLCFDAITVPAAGAVPLFAFPIAGSNIVSAYYGSTGRWFDRGIVLCNSSTFVTLTIGTADCLFDVQYA